MNEEQVRFSIIVPTYNRSKFLKIAISSVIGQSYTNWELLIIDDGSTDDTKSLIHQFRDDRIKYVYQENSERAVARNNGIKLVTGSYICFLDSDDYYLPNHLESFQKLIIQKQHPVAFMVSNTFSELSGMRSKVEMFRNDYNHPVEFYWNHTILTPISVCIHHKILENNKFPENFKKAFWEDTHLWLRIMAQYQFAYNQDYTAVLSNHSERSSQRINLQRANDHIGMMESLFRDYHSILEKYITKKMLIDKIYAKYQAFIYLARLDKNPKLGFALLKKAYTSSFSLRRTPYFIITLIKLIFAKINIHLR